jgi:hypothetical protein
LNFWRTIASLLGLDANPPTMQEKENPRLHNEMTLAISDVDQHTAILKKLQVASELLMMPTPKSIREVELLLEEVNSWVCEVSGTSANPASLSHVKEIHAAAIRARKLLEGALRFQWARMRQIASVTQSYTAGGKILQWQPAGASFEAKV